MDLATSGLKIAEEIGDSPTKSWACQMSAITSILKGELVDAERHTRAMIEIAERVGIATLPSEWES